ncbi:hypothetical protein E2C01_001575 [Portunus trituberculatus]|uniref:Uncharacterized protein n=1 Tax=Portunus trituberculatus TaxID=210409 RepID=A0A5B7CKS2_PORTR|nr:hypothetical protein [Portunus trituberculatus]
MKRKVCEVRKVIPIPVTSCLIPPTAASLLPPLSRLTLLSQVVLGLSCTYLAYLLVSLHLLAASWSIPQHTTPSSSAPGNSLTRQPFSPCLAFFGECSDNRSSVAPTA